MVDNIIFLANFQNDHIHLHLNERYEMSTVVSKNLLLYWPNCNWLFKAGFASVVFSIPNAEFLFTILERVLALRKLVTVLEDLKIFSVLR